MFPDNGVKQVDVDEFNRQTHASLEDIRDFIVLHYKATERGDTPFWRHCRSMEVPESLARRLALFEQTGRLFLADNELFTDSWLQVMIGQGIVPQAYHAVVDTMAEDELKSFLSQIKSNIDKTVEQMPMHADYLETFCRP